MDLFIFFGPLFARSYIIHTPTTYTIIIHKNMQFNYAWNIISGDLVSCHVIKFLKVDKPLLWHHLDTVINNALRAKFSTIICCEKDLRVRILYIIEIVVKYFRDTQNILISFCSKTYRIVNFNGTPLKIISNLNLSAH